MVEKVHKEALYLTRIDNHQSQYRQMLVRGSGVVVVSDFLRKNPIQAFPPAMLAGYRINAQN